MAKIREATEKTLLRQQIIDVSRNLFEAQGIKPITMDMIAKSMKISKRTLYEIFRDKESLLIETLNSIRLHEHNSIDEFCREHDNVLEVILHVLNRKMEQMKHVNPRFLSDLTSYPTVLLALKESNHHSTEDATEFFQRGVQQGLFRDDINFPVFLHLLHLQMREICFGEITAGDTHPKDILNSVIFVTLRGISTEKGLNQIEEYVTRKELGK